MIILYSIFVIISIILIIFYIKNQSLKIYKLSILLLVLSFLISSISIFNIKSNKNTNNQVLSSNIGFVLDVSKSMKVEDIKEDWSFNSRINSAKKIIENYVTANENNKYSLTIFTKEALRILPFTSDSELLLTILDSCDENNLSVQWTDLIEALKWWIKNFTSDEKSWTLIIISDWADENTWDLKEIKKQLLNRNISVVIIWIWSKNWWYIPIWNDAFWRILYKVYKWNKVISKLNETSLINVSKEINWTYFRFDDLWNFSKIGTIISKTTKNTTINWENNTKTINRELIIVSFVLWCLYLIALIKWRKK